MAARPSVVADRVSVSSRAALDVEPHALPRWKAATGEGRRALLEEYVGLGETLRARLGFDWKALAELRRVLPALEAASVPGLELEDYELLRIAEAAAGK